MEKTKHPCFNADARHTHGRIHLPIAPTCNVQCNFCNRKFDCVNESRPGVTTKVLTPKQASGYVQAVLDRVHNIAVLGVAGPGDPFADAERTLATLDLVHTEFPDKLLCLSSNGLNLPGYAQRLKDLNVSHVTITVNAVDPEIGARIYAWVRDGYHVLRGVQGAKVLLERQTQAIKELKDAGLTVKINTVVIPTINDHHVPQISKYVAALGADVQNCIPLMNVEGTPFGQLPAPEPAAMQELRLLIGKDIKQMTHCARCRADAVGLLGQQNSLEVQKLLDEASKNRPSKTKPYVAVASKEGLFVNQHLGEATKLWVFGLVDNMVRLVDTRMAPHCGGGDERWEAMAQTFSDCFTILSGGFGPAPEKLLSDRGITLVAAECLIDDAAKTLLEGNELPRVYQKTAGLCGKGAACSGTGQGCA